MRIPPIDTQLQATQSRQTLPPFISFDATCVRMASANQNVPEQRAKKSAQGDRTARNLPSPSS